MKLVEAIVYLARRRGVLAAGRREPQVPEQTMHAPLPTLVLPPAAPVSRLEPPVLPSRSGWPTRGRISSRFGYRFHPILKKVKLHAGVDIAAPAGTFVWATGAGVVRFAGVQRGYGKTIVIDHSNGLQTLYAHLSAVKVRFGQRVVAGEKIGAVGQTGRATGPHLHYEVRRNGEPIDPRIA